MTNEEAIELIQKRMCCENQFIIFAQTTGYRQQDFCEIANAINMLDKQIPKEKKNKGDY